MTLQVLLALRPRVLQASERDCCLENGQSTRVSMALQVGLGWTPQVLEPVEITGWSSISIVINEVNGVPCHRRQ